MRDAARRTATLAVLTSTVNRAQGHGRADDCAAFWVLQHGRAALCTVVRACVRFHLLCRRSV